MVCSCAHVIRPGAFETAQAVAIVGLFDHFGRGRTAAIRVLQPLLVHTAGMLHLLDLIRSPDQRAELEQELAHVTILTCA